MKVGFYECDITPPLGCFLWGHYRELIAQEVHNKLFAKAIVMQDGGDVSAILVVDSCVLPVEMHDTVTKRIFEYTGISADKVCIASNHAHWGAPIFDSPEIGYYRDEPYTDVFFRLCADAVTLAYHRLKECNIKFGTSIAPGLAFCRDYILDDGSYVTFAGRPNTVGVLDTPDEELPVLFFENSEGKPLGAIISYALHQCTVDEKTTGYSGDYASVLSEKLKEKYGNAFVSVFLIGTCGDVNHTNPDFSAPHNAYKEIGAKLSEYLENSLNSATDIKNSGIKSVKEYVNVKRRSSDTEFSRKFIKQHIDEKNLMRARNALYYVSRKQPDSTDLAVQCIKVGDVLIICLPGEIFTEYGRRLKKESPFKKTIVIENCNTYCGYIPTRKAFDEKHNDLYETSLGYHSCHVAEAGDIIVNKALELANKLDS